MVSDAPFRLHYDVPRGEPWEGWRVTFTLETFPHGVVGGVFASNGSVSFTDPRKISEILSVDMWPEFAAKTFRQRVGKMDEEMRLF